MKSISQIKTKIEEHEKGIRELLNPDEINDINILHVENYLQGRKALLWILSDKELLDGPDDFEKWARYEMSTFEASKIF